MTVAGETARPPSVDAVARSLAPTGLPHPLLVDIARLAIAEVGEVPNPDAVVGAEQILARAAALADDLARSLLQPVVNATGVLLHTNLGRAPVGFAADGRPLNLEFDLHTGRRGSRQRAVGDLLARLCGAEAVLVVNNNAAAVLLVLAAIAAGRDVPVSRGEAVEIGGAFRVPEIIAQSGARLVDVGTTNRTRLADYRAAIARPGIDAALVLRVHPSNYHVDGFTESTPVSELATLGVPVVVDIGSGLLDAATPWLAGGPPAWLSGEPAARQTLEQGAGLVTFSTDKLMGGPQAGIIAGRADLVALCARHPLARALRPGGLVLGALQQVALAYLDRDLEALAFWRMATTPVADLRSRAEAIAHRLDTEGGPDPISRAPRSISAHDRRLEPLDAVPGAGSVPGITIPSFGITLAGDHLAALRAHHPPVIGRIRDGRTILDLRSVAPVDDAEVAAAIGRLR